MKKALGDLAGLLPHTRSVEKASRMSAYDTIRHTLDPINVGHSDNAAGQIYTDKIDIIERAVEYIGNLQKELAETNSRLKNSNFLGKDVSNEGKNIISRQGS
jgi:hypothetical protein